VAGRGREPAHGAAHGCRASEWWTALVTGTA
jgi:hypothetical protein